MKEKPILFSKEMVTAILEGKKTQTRRILKPQPGDDIDNLGDNQTVIDMKTGTHIKCPYGQIDDVLWVRETWATGPNYDDVKPSELSGDEDIIYKATEELLEPNKWRPSIFMPKWASRIKLKIKNIRVERICAISDYDAINEGIHRQSHQWQDPEYPLQDIGYKATANAEWIYSSPHRAFRELWEQVNGKASWIENPWVWVVEFEQMK